MTSWHDLPYEIHLLIVHSYIDIVLAELDASPINTRSHAFISRAVYRLTSLVIVLPLLRKDIVRFCQSKGTMYEDMERMRDKPTSSCMLTMLNGYWREESWRHFRELSLERGDGIGRQLEAPSDPKMGRLHW